MNPAGASLPTRTVHLLVNPTAGRGRGRRLLPQVMHRLQATPGLDVRFHVGASYREQQRLASDIVASAGRFDTLAVMGGDGMVHLGLNACALTPVPLCVLPVGTGNDFCRGAGLPTTLDGAVDALVRGWSRATDLMRTDDATGTRWVGSVLSTGYDAAVNHRANHLSERYRAFGGLAYGGVAIAELARFTPLPYRLVVDGNPRNLDAILVAVGNAGYFGGGMHICPDADVTDGLLDVVVVHAAGPALLRILPRLYRGTHVDHPLVETFRAREIRVDGQGLRPMGDGEELGTVPVLATCVPDAVKLVVA